MVSAVPDMEAVVNDELLVVDTSPVVNVPLVSFTRRHDLLRLAQSRAILQALTMPPQQPHPLRIHGATLGRLREWLQGANRHNRRFTEQYRAFEQVLRTVIARLSDTFASEIDRVLLHSDSLAYGIDLRKLPYDDVLFIIVLRGEQRSYRLYEQISERVFADIDSPLFLPQFDLVNQSTWQHMQAVASAGQDREQARLPVLIADVT